MRTAYYNATEVVAKLKSKGFRAHLVGGCVRDLFIGREPKDYDVTTDAKPMDVMLTFGNCVKPTGLKHGTVTIVLPQDPDTFTHVEVTTWRGDGQYSDGRRPDEVHFVKTLEEDLARRDFTMNAVAYDPIALEFVDPFGGRKDIEDQMIRAVGDPLKRFGEDGLRCMRAIRFAAQLSFSVDTETYDAIAKCIDTFKMVSAERVRDELVKILASNDAMAGIINLQATTLLQHIMPELLEGVGMGQNRHHKHDVWGHIMRSVDAAKPHVRLAALMHDIGKPRTRTPHPERPGECQFLEHAEVGAEMTQDILRRLKFDNTTIDRTSRLVKNHMRWYSPRWSNGTVRRFVRNVGEDLVTDLLDLQEADLTGHGTNRDIDAEVGVLRRRIETLGPSAHIDASKLAINGNDIMRELDMGPGPHVGLVLKDLLERVTDEPELNNRDDLLRMVQGFVKE